MAFAEVEALVATGGTVYVDADDAAVVTGCAVDADADDDMSDDDAGVLVDDFFRVVFDADFAGDVVELLPPLKPAAAPLASVRRLLNIGILRRRLLVKNLDIFVDIRLNGCRRLATDAESVIVVSVR